MRVRLSAALGSVLLLIAACTGAATPPGSPSSSPGASAAPSRQAPAGASGDVTRPPFPRVSLPGASAAASASVAPGGSGDRAIETSLEAIEAIAGVETEFEGYRPQPPDVIGASSNVLVQEDSTGFLVTFVTGSGDCFAGCINTRYDKFHVSFAGEVDRLCTWTIGDEEEGTPC